MNTGADEKKIFTQGKRYSDIELQYCKKWKYIKWSDYVHEMALAQGILATALDAASSNDAVKIGRIKLLVGEMTNVEPESLKFCFTALAAGTIAEGAELDISITPLVGRCSVCGSEFPVKGYYFICTQCQSSSVEIVSGRELRVDHLEVE